LFKKILHNPTSLHQMFKDASGIEKHTLKICITRTVVTISQYKMQHGMQYKQETVVIQ